MLFQILKLWNVLMDHGGRGAESYRFFNTLEFEHSKDFELLSVTWQLLQNVRLCSINVAEECYFCAHKLNPFIDPSLVIQWIWC